MNSILAEDQSLHNILKDLGFLDLSDKPDLPKRNAYSLVLSSNIEEVKLSAKKME